MSKKTIMILGAGIMQIPAYELAEKEGWNTIAVDGDPNAIAVDLAHEFWHIDLKDRIGIVEKAEEYRNNHLINGVFTCGTDFSTTVAWVTEKLGLPGISYQTALNATDKVRMRLCFKEAGLPVPPFAEFHEEDLNDRISLDFPYPVVVKPVDSMGARGVVKVNRQESLLEALKSAISFSRSKRAIVESFLEGPEFSLDALIYENQIDICGIADRKINFPPYFVEMGHHFPSVHKKNDQERVIQMFKKGIKALGIDYGSAKGDIKLTPEGPVIGEIAARLSGGFMSGWTYPYASERKPILAAMHLAMGENPQIKPEDKLIGSVERAILSIPGRIKEIRNLEEVHQREHIHDIFLLKDVGDEVSFPISNVQKIANVLGIAESGERAISLVEEALSDIHVILEPGENSTAEFLNRQGAWPSAAYHPVPLEILDREDIDFFNIPPGPVEDIHWIQGLDKKNRDWLNTALDDQLERLQSEYSLDFIEGPSRLLDLYFWTALFYGGIQGARWFLDSCSS